MEHAAGQIGCTEAEIAKKLSFIVDDKPVIVVMVGDGKVNSSKFKVNFHTKQHMISREQVAGVMCAKDGKKRHEVNGKRKWQVDHARIGLE